VAVLKEVIGDATLYLGDCLEVLDGIEKASIDLLVTDPPYGMDFKSGKGNHEKIANDHRGFDVKPYLSAALKTLKRGRHVYVFGPLDIGGLPLCSPSELVWDKLHIGMGDLTLPWAPQHEPITFAVYEISKANREKGYGNLAARLRKGSILRSLRPNSGRANLHPTEKPVDILCQMIESSSVLGETVLDCFVGSGSTVVAAIRERRKAIGIEIEPRNFDIACRRAEHAWRLQEMQDEPMPAKPSQLMLEAA
jgi:DNA modification methylase